MPQQTYSGLIKRSINVWEKRKLSLYPNSYFKTDYIAKIDDGVRAHLIEVEKLLPETSKGADQHKFVSALCLSILDLEDDLFFLPEVYDEEKSKELQNRFKYELALDLFLAKGVDVQKTYSFATPCNLSGEDKSSTLYNDLLFLLIHSPPKLLSLSMIAFFLQQQFPRENS